MQEIDTLLETIDTLLGPNGCPWDQKQTLASVRKDLLEEACEVIDAIDEKNPTAIQEELGDVLFVVLFLLRLAEKEKVSTPSAIATSIKEKLIRRHPHVFSDVKQLTQDEVLHQWDQIKKKEKGERGPFDRVPQSLPALSRAVEVLKQSKKQNIELNLAAPQNPELILGKALFDLAQQASHQKIDPELALRKYIKELIHKSC